MKTALKFEEFVASRRDLNEQQALRVLGLSEGDLGEDIPGKIAVFDDCCYALPVGDGTNAIFAPIFGAEITGADEDVMWGLYWGHYLPEQCQPNDQLTLVVLADAFRIYCQREGLAYASTDEVLAAVLASTDERPLPAKQLVQYEDITWFINAWNDVEGEVIEA